jgi:hypothetical protein
MATVGDRDDETLSQVDPRSPSERFELAVLATLTVGLVALALYAASPLRTRFGASLVAILSFVLAPVLFPRVRARLDAPLCPINWVLLVFMFQLVIDPLLLCYSGPFINTLPALPGDGAINASLLVSVLAWVAFVAGVEISWRWRPAPPRYVRKLMARSRPQFSDRRLIAAFALAGLVGLGLAFHSPGALLEYFRSASGHVGFENNTRNSGLVQSVSVLLRPFLASALVILWCGWVDRRPHDHRLALRTLAIAVLVLLASATYSYNRATAVAPLVAMAAVYGLRVIRLRVWVLALVAVLALGGLTFARAYRNSHFTVAQLVTSSHARHTVLDNVSLNREIQIYTSAPQFLGYLLERTGWGHDPHYGRTMLSSLMFPVPRLGAPFRATSGLEIYNHLIYGAQSTDTDQVTPFQGELFLDFALPGVMIGYALLALAVGWLQRGFEQAKSAFGLFAWQYVATWLALLVIGSLAVFSQVALYFFWPIAVYGLLRSRPTLPLRAVA